MDTLDPQVPPLSGPREPAKLAGVLDGPKGNDELNRATGAPRRPTDRFSVVKALDSFDILTIPSLNRAMVLELARYSSCCATKGSPNLDSRNCPSSTRIRRR